MDNLWIGSLENYAGVGLMFNIALDGQGLPTLPGTNSCGSGCRPIVTVNSDGSFSYNQECASFSFFAQLPETSPCNSLRLGSSVKSDHPKRCRRAVGKTYRRICAGEPQLGFARGRVLD
jgi:hypothetical protein